MSMQQPSQTNNAEEEKDVKKGEEDDYASCFNKNKKSNGRAKRTKSMLTDHDDEENKELRETVEKVVPKKEPNHMTHDFSMLYVLPSILEEELSNSSSSSRKNSEEPSLSQSPRSHRRNRSSM